MIVGTAEVTCRVPSSTSLKEKRSVIKSGLQRIQHRFNLSVAEVGHQDHRQLALLALAGVASNKKIVEHQIQQALRLLEEKEGLEILDTVVTLL
ncbi:DUF503 domain-containing protein [Mechercharimyces sp. CAU 1602]|uniref:DUF503 domain-containing protein n=1 Tax=Mechercharimyces sp. CAU 1602 TaxID=2973933 RepID=UPI002161D99B|nr:DUF503 domain-containing protein [Mechercharimyces sp. CAU 1602]MCS1351276.1 DUF503 domain-containing protein [Mechercharimyces sp. CAU 1602]